MSTSDELASSREPRLAARRKERHDRYVHLLQLALRTRLDNGFSPERLQEVLTQGEHELGELTNAVGGRIYPRRRPQPLSTSDTCTVFIDECGSHMLQAKDSFQAFVLAAVIIADKDSAGVDRKWKRWKRDYLGSSAKLVHEPDIRRAKGSFWCDGDSAKRGLAVRSLDRIISRLDFGLVVCVINRPAYVSEVGEQALDASLPDHPYLMAMHFIAERLAIALHGHYGGARGRVVFESRGPREDANMQYEFARLFLDGTSYVAPTWFRRQFFPGIEFRAKEANATGLQLADLAARPCGEKVLNLPAMPPRWEAFREKLVPGIETAHSIVGMKIVPWEDKYLNVWKS